MDSVKLAPDVQNKMYTAKFWTEKINNEDFLSTAQIKKINQNIYNKAEQENKEHYYCDLKKFVQNLNVNNLNKMIENTYCKNINPGQNYFNLQGKAIGIDQRESIKKNCDLASVKAKKTISIKYGVLCRRSNIRALPTEITFASKKESGDQDLLQLTALSCGSAVLILAESRDQKWYFIQAKLMRGWVKKDNVALTDSIESAQAYLNTDSFLIVSGSRIETEPSPFNQDTTNRFFQMGDKIPLVKQKGSIGNMNQKHPQTQSSLGNYLVWLPVKNKDNKLEYKRAVIAVSNDVNTGCIKLNRENIIRQAFKMLGERYDWGGKYKRRDCSRFIMDIFRSFGIELPRNAELQEKISPFKNYFFKGNLKDKKDIINKLEAGDILHMPGHIMLYLGEYQDKNFLIHAASGYGEFDEQGSLKAKSIRSVFIMELEQLLKDEEKPYLEKFSSASKIN